MLIASTLPPSSESGAARTALLVAYGAFSYVAAATLGFLASLLLNIVDAAFTCHALDLDSGADHQPRMRAALAGVIKPTAVVQQPGGVPPVIAVAAGVPVQQQQQHAVA